MKTEQPLTGKRFCGLCEYVRTDTNRYRYSNLAVDACREVWECRLDNKLCEDRNPNGTCEDFEHCRSWWRSLVEAFRYDLP